MAERQQHKMSQHFHDFEAICNNVNNNSERLNELLLQFPFLIRHHFFNGNLAIHKAIENNCSNDIISRLIDAWPALLNERNDSDMLPLHVACLHVRSHDILCIILRPFPNNASVVYDTTQLPLHDALTRTPPLRLEFIDMLVRHSMDTIHDRGRYERNVLHCTLQNKNQLERVIHYVVDLFPDNENIFLQRDENGMTPLHLACLHHNASIIIKVHNKNKKAIRLTDKERNVPFHFACGRSPMLATNTLHDLLNAWTECVVQRSSDGSIPLHCIVEARPTGKDALLFISRLIYLFNKSVTITNNNGDTALHIACQHCKDCNVISLLLMFGPTSVNVYDNNGNLPLHYALKQLHPIVPSHVIAQMIQIQPSMVIASRNANDPPFLPIYYAICDHPDSTVHIMVDCNPQCLQVVADPYGRLALHIACRKGKTSLIAFLIDKNPDAVRVRDSKHKLPIHYASALQPSLPPIVLQQLVHTWPGSCYEYYQKEEEDNDSDTYDSTNVFARDPDDPGNDSD